MFSDGQWFTIAVTILTVGGGVDIWLLKCFSRPCTLHSGIEAQQRSGENDRNEIKSNQLRLETSSALMRSELFNAIASLSKETKEGFAEQRALIERTMMTPRQSRNNG